MTKFLKSGNTFNVYTDAAMDIHPALPPATFSVKFNSNTGQFFLEQIDDFDLRMKLYGDVVGNSDRILNTFKSRVGSTGVLLAGEKGSGKTLLAKQLSVQARTEGIPTIVINEPLFGSVFNEFIQNISQPVVILFDEFEKVYDREEQSQMLTLLDGVYTTKKLFVLTCNEEHRINYHMMNRPGRLFYYLKFDGIEAGFITEYCADNLQNMNHAATIVKMASVFSKFNFDMLQALVEEMNRYDESPFDAIKLLNVNPESDGHIAFNMELAYEGKKISPEYIHSTNNGVLQINPLAPFEVYFQTSEYENEDDSVEVNFVPDDIKSVDGDQGIFIFETSDKKVVMKLIRQKSSPYSLWDSGAF